MASPNTTNNGQIVPKAPSDTPLSPIEQGQRSLASALAQMGPEIARALPKHITPERMGRIALTALRQTPDLALCTRESFLGAILAAAQLGLEVNTPLGHAYLIPYKDFKKNVTTCQLIIGYQGMIELAYRSGRVSSISAHTVRSGDHFEFELGLRPKLAHRPSDAADRESQPITHAYAVAQIKDGEPIPWVLSMPQIEARRKRGASGRTYPDGNRVKTPWDTDYEAMALKSAVRALFKWIPKSPELVSAIAMEDASERGRLEVEIPSIRDGLTSRGFTVPAISAQDHDTTTGEVLEPEDLASAAAKIDAGEA